MTFHYPPPPSRRGEVDAPLPPSYLASHDLAPGNNTAPMEMRPPQPITLRGRDEPFIPPSDPESSQSGSAGEKKRNKLGYHRTTMACGHCRRRKIRCIPSASDIHGRCVNCIRLKKECTFHPVDQPPSAHDRAQPPSRASTGPQSSSASSSPAPHHGNSPPLAPMGPNQGQSYPSATMPKTRHAEQMLGSTAPGAAATFAHRAADPSNAGIASRQHQGYSGQHPVHWTGPDTGQDSLSGQVGVKGQWRSFSAHASPFPPYTSQSASSSWDSDGPDNTRADTLPWAPYAPVHTRSVSRSEGDLGSQHFQHVPQHSRPGARNMPDQASSNMYQASMPAGYPGAGAGNESAGAMAHGGSFATPPAPSSNVDYWQQYPYMRVNDGYADWSYSYPEMNSSMRSEN